jgi:hypothetical protein
MAEVGTMKQAFLIVAVLGIVDPNCTLKDICPHVNEVSGPRKRPASSFMTALKIRQMKALGLKGDPSQYEEDHIVSISLCGATSDPNNLTPELWPRARAKDVYEARFHKAVCAGTMDLKDAQKQIVTYE